MSLSLEKFKASDFKVYVNDYDEEHGDEASVIVRVTPQQRNTGYGEVSYTAKINFYEQTLTEHDVEYDSDIGHKRTLVAMARKYLKTKDPSRYLRRKNASDK